MAAIEITGTVESVTLESRTPFDPYIGRYSPNTEYTEFYLKVALRDEQGNAVYFNTPGVIRSVANCPGASVVTFDVTKNASKWVKEEGTQKVATQSHSNNNHLTPLVKTGDTITIRGTLKTETTSKAGNHYRVLNRITLKS